jgi:hypothetical protein
MSEERIEQANLWIVARIADVLVDLADDGEDDSIDVDELHDQMQNVAEMIVEALNLRVESADQHRATCTLGDPE